MPNDNGNTQVIIPLVEINANNVLYIKHIKKFCNGITLIIARVDKMTEMIKKIAGCSVVVDVVNDDDDAASSNVVDDRGDDVNAIP